MVNIRKRGKVYQYQFEIAKVEGQTNLYTSDIKLIENQLDEKIEQLNGTTDISKLTEYKKEINKLITRKANIVGEKSPSGSYLKKLYTQRTELHLKVE